MRFRSDDSSGAATHPAEDTVEVEGRHGEAAAAAASGTTAIRDGEGMRVLATPPLLLRSAVNNSTAAATSAPSQETLRAAAMMALASLVAEAEVEAGAEEGIKLA